MKIENSLLLDFFENGNTKSFEELFKMTKPWLYRLIYAIVNNKDDADEILQQTWVKVLSTIHRFDIKQGKINNYLYTIAKNKSLKWKSRNNRFVNENEQYKIKEVTINTEANNLLSDSEIIERNTILNTAVKKLDRNYQDVILLYYFSEFDVKKIAQMMDKPEGTVKTWLARARKKLKENLLKSDYIYYTGAILFGYIIFFPMVQLIESIIGGMK